MGDGRAHLLAPVLIANAYRVTAQQASGKPPHASISTTPECAILPVHRRGYAAAEINRRNDDPASVAS